MRRVLRTLFLVLALLALLPAMLTPVYAQQHVPRRIAVPTGTVKTAQGDPYTPHLPRRALAYQRTRRVLGLIGMAWNLLGLWLFVRTGLGVRLRNAVYRTLRRPVPEDEAVPPLHALAFYYAAYALLLLLWNLPFGFGSLAIEHTYGFSRETAFGYLGDSLISVGFNCAIIFPLWIAYRFYVRSPHRWWLWLWAGLVPLIFFVIVLQPVVVAPAYNHYTPLPAGPLRDKILDLADRAGIRNARVLIEDTSRRTTHVNAYVNGLGPSAQIVINDTALAQLPEDQLLAMLAHEMGHYVEKHVWWGFLSGALGAGAFLWIASRLLPWMLKRWGERLHLRGLTDLAALPLLMLFISLFLLMQDPIANGISRYMEHRADAYGLRLAHLNDATARLFVGFAERDFSDPRPPALLHFWFGTH
ncbi:MAG TPA: M48 family metallopeptidase, partial [Chthonomonadaceae bacterium]|nr:M48 family metallopeptidase [Chthonomonadaceae bacterium]